MVVDEVSRLDKLGFGATMLAHMLREIRVIVLSLITRRPGVVAV